MIYNNISYNTFLTNPVSPPTIHFKHSSPDARVGIFPSPPPQPSAPLAPAPSHHPWAPRTSTTGPAPRSCQEPQQFRAERCRGPRALPPAWRRPSSAAPSAWGRCWRKEVVAPHPGRPTARSCCRGNAASKASLRRSHVQLLGDFNPSWDRPFLTDGGKKKC